jgi:A/G-specific adenine glycosylase
MSVDASNALLSWYAVDKRSLPWRAEAGQAPDPYRVWLSEVMLQQTTVAAVRPRFETFARRWPTVEALAAADEGEVMAAWAGLGYYARARNLIACAREVATRHGGRFPASEDALRTLPGVGRYTAAAIAAIAFGQRAVVVDANVERVVSRLFAVEQPLPGSRPKLHALTDTITPRALCGDFAQAMMDLGSAICTPRQPACGICPLRDGCAARLQGNPEAYPRKLPKVARPKRRGSAYWLEHDGLVLLVRRPPRGLLGGLLGLPGGGWSEEGRTHEDAPAAADWAHAGSIGHVFTHFALTLDLYCAVASDLDAAGTWWPVERIGEAGLPTLFAKAAARGLAWRQAA